MWSALVKSVPHLLRNVVTHRVHPRLLPTRKISWWVQKVHYHNQLPTVKQRQARDNGSSTPLPDSCDFDFVLLWHLRQGIHISCCIAMNNIHWMSPSDQLNFYLTDNIISGQRPRIAGSIGGQTNRYRIPFSSPPHHHHFHSSKIDDIPPYINLCICIRVYLFFSLLLESIIVSVKWIYVC